MGRQFLQHQIVTIIGSACRTIKRSCRYQPMCKRPECSRWRKTCYDWHPSLGWVGNGRRPPRRLLAGERVLVLGCVPSSGCPARPVLLLGGVQPAASAPDAQDRASRQAPCAWTCAPASTARAASAAGCRSTSSSSTRAASSRRSVEVVVDQPGGRSTYSFVPTTFSLPVVLPRLSNRRFTHGSQPARTRPTTA